MTDDRRLRDKLAKLAAGETEPGARRLPGPDLVQAILEEIDETILARRLAFAGEDGATLALAVANRRLLGLVEAPEDLLPPADRDRLLAPLPPDDDAALAALAEVIARFAAGRSGLAVASLLLGRTVGAAMTGRSAEAVAQALGRDLYDPPAPPVRLDPAEGFAAGLAGLALAVVEIAEGAPGPAAGPDAAAVARLARLDAAGLAALGNELDSQPGAAPFLLLAAGGAALFLGRRPDGSGVAALLPADRAGDVAALWQETGGA